MGPLLFFCLLAFAISACPDLTFTRRWSSVNPAAGTTVTIPANEKWLFDLANSPLYTGVYIYGELVFSDQMDVQLNSFHVTVQSGGTFTIGSCDCRYQHKAIIQLGPVTNQTANPDRVGTKVVGALPGGTINFYGQVFGPTWTNLESTANVGDTSITLIESVSWRVGDRIALAPTTFPLWQDPNNALAWEDRSDEVTITAVNGKVVSFSPALKYMHYSGILQGIDMRGEVALLTRNILIQGDPASNTTSFGAHMMFLRNSSVQLHAIEVTRAGQLGVLARYPVHWHMAGSALGSRIVDSSIHHNYQRSLTIHATHNVTVERNVAFKTRGHMYFLEDAIENDNYFAWNLGMVNYIIPDGPQQLIPSDSQPAIFWITNPGNTFVHNVGVGSPAHCFWFSLPINPLGPSNTRAIIPRWTPLKKFAYNKAHSCASDGLHIDSMLNQAGVPGGDDPDSVKNYQLTGSQTETITVGSGYHPQGPIQDGGPSDYDYYYGTTKSINANFEAFTAYKCKGNGAWSRGANLTFTRPQFVDVAVGITFACSSCYCNDATFIHSSENYGTLRSWEQSVGSYGLINNSLSPPFRDIPRDWPSAADAAGTTFGPFWVVRGYEFYDGPNELNNARFYGYKGDQRAGATAIGTLREDQFSLSGANKLSSVWFDASTTIRAAFPDLIHDGDKATIYRDTDGSLTGYVPPANNPEQFGVVTNLVPFYFTSGCVMGQNNQHYVCPNHFLEFSFSLDGVTYPADLSTRTTGLVSFTRPDKTGSPLWLCGGPCNPGGKSVTDKMYASSYFFGTLMAFRDYYVQFATSIPQSWTFRIGAQRSSVNGDGLAPYFETTIAVCYPKTAVISSVMWNWKDGVTQATSLAAMRTQAYLTDWFSLGNGMWYQDKTTGWVYVRMIIRNSQQQTPFGDGDGSWIRIDAAAAYPTTTCVVPTVATVPDTIRTLPPYSGPKVGGTPPAWKFALSAMTPRDDVPCTGSPAPTPVVLPTPTPTPTPTYVDTFP